MKKLLKVSTVAVMLSVFFGQSVNAQFLDKLKKNVEQKVEQTVINKTSDKASQKTGDAIDKLFNQKIGEQKGKKITPDNVPESFSFEYQYRLTMTTVQSKSKMNLDYFLKPGENYMGVKMNQGQEIFMIMEGQSNINYMFMNSGGNKIATATAIDGDDIIEDDTINYEDYTITDLPNKTFLGYDCKGKQMENSEYVFKMYFTNEAPVSFNDVFKMDTDRIPEAIKRQFDGSENATMMYMEMKDKVNKGKRNTSGTIECTLLEPSNFTFNTSGYKFY